MSADPPIDRHQAVEWRSAWRSRSDQGAGPCPSDERLAELVVGELSVDERQSLADHVTSCRRCADSYRALQELHDSASGSRPGADAGSAGAAWGRRRPLLVAAAVVLLGALGWITLHVGFGPSGSVPSRARGAAGLELIPEPPQGSVLDAPPSTLAWRLAGAADPANAVDAAEPGRDRGDRLWVVEIYDAEMRPLWRSEATSRPAVDLPPDLLAEPAAPVTVYWRVRAGVDGTGPSALFRFRIER